MIRNPRTDIFDFRLDLAVEHICRHGICPTTDNARRQIAQLGELDATNRVRATAAVIVRGVVRFHNAYMPYALIDELVAGLRRGALRELCAYLSDADALAANNITWRELGEQLIRVSDERGIVIMNLVVGAAIGAPFDITRPTQGARTDEEFAADAARAASARIVRRFADLSNTLALLDVLDRDPASYDLFFVLAADRNNTASFEDLIGYANAAQIIYTT